ncbi:unnamed protein product [Urochloa humidicola]
MPLSLRRRRSPCAAAPPAIFLLPHLLNPRCCRRRKFTYVVLQIDNLLQLCKDAQWRCSWLTAPGATHILDTLVLVIIFNWRRSSALIPEYVELARKLTQYSSGVNIQNFKQYLFYEMLDLKENRAN